MDNRFQTGGKAENLNREERIAIRSRFFSILAWLPQRHRLTINQGCRGCDLNSAKTERGEQEATFDTIELVLSNEVREEDTSRERNVRFSTIRKARYVIYFKMDTTHVCLQSPQSRPPQCYSRWYGN